MITCDICNKELKRSGNDNLYFCSMEIVWVESLRRNLKYNHSFISLNPNREILNKLITVPPYVFDINCEKKTTKIKKIVSFKQKMLISDYVSLDMDHEEKEFLEIDVVLGGANFPWNDLKKIEEKLKIYNLFS